VQSERKDCTLGARPARETRKPMNFKVGDKVRVRHGRDLGDNTKLERVITHIGKKWVLYDRDGVENCMDIESFAENMEPDFFEEGKTYRRKMKFNTGYWYFRVEAVRKRVSDESGSQPWARRSAAFGFLGAGKDFTEGDWTVRDHYSWTTAGWEEVPNE
jgi:hypothetical protein